MRPTRIVAVVHRGRADAPEAIETLRQWCARRGVELSMIDLGDPTLPVEPDESTLALSMGGDGTFLHTARLVAAHATPILGINLGSLGFLTQTGTESLEQALDQVWHDRIAVEPRLRLQAAVRDHAASALNDVVISRPDVNTTTSIDLYRGADTFVGRYPGDGLILSTPSGTTAYSLACGGPIVDPTLDCVTVTPLNAHRISLRPLVLPPDVELTAELHRSGWLVLDGEKHARLEAGETVRVRRAADDTRMIVLDDRLGFVDLLSKKLGWSWGYPGTG